MVRIRTPVVAAMVGGLLFDLPFASSYVVHPTRSRTTSLHDLPFASSYVYVVHPTRSRTTSLHALNDATFGMGCFWKPSEAILSVPGVQSSMAGYSGKPAYSGKPPSYQDVCASREWVEAVRVTYDDEQITYPQLLDAFFEASEANPGARQYASIIFPSDDQLPQAEDWLSVARQERRINPKGVPAMATTVEPLTKFYRAEEYHQEFWQKNRPRFAVGVVLLAISSGALNAVIPNANTAQHVETLANAIFLLGALAMQAERWLDKEVIEM